MSIIKSREKGDLIVISGPCGAGKGTIIKKILETNKNIWLSISTTSRSVRGTEQEGIDYFYVTKEEFEKKIENDDFLEYAVVVNNQYYGTPKDKILDKLNQGQDVILEIDIQGALQVQEKIDDAIFIFIMPPSMKILKERLINRNTESEEKILDRFKTAYKEINEVTKYNYVVVNDDLEKAVKKVESILLAERCRVDRIEEVYLNNEEELLHEALVGKDIENTKREIE